MTQRMTPHQPVTIKVGTGSYIISYDYGEYRLRRMVDGKPNLKSDKTAKELDEIFKYLSAAEKTTVKDVEDSYYGIENN